MKRTHYIDAAGAVPCGADKAFAIAVRRGRVASDRALNVSCSAAQVDCFKCKRSKALKAVPLLQENRP